MSEPLDRLLSVPAPAKLNLFLHILGRRDDGRHLLQSLFVLIDWADTLDLQRREDGRIERLDSTDTSSPELPPDDLVVRAARALQQATQTRYGVSVRLHKRLPQQAGLGGGSSDAASALLALNRLWDLRLTRTALADIGLTLGADVPFFLAGQSSWAEGIGERLTPLPVPCDPVLVIKPPQGVSTADIFGHPSLKRDSKPLIMADFAARGDVSPWEACRNDLQAVAQTLCPPISQGLSWLREHGLQGRMTGSGSALFALGGTDADLNDLPVGWEGRHASILGVHPLRGWCRD